MSTHSEMATGKTGVTQQKRILFLDPDETDLSHTLICLRNELGDVVDWFPTVEEARASGIDQYTIAVVELRDVPLSSKGSSKRTVTPNRQYYFGNEKRSPVGGFVRDLNAAGAHVVIATTYPPGQERSLFGLESEVLTSVFHKPLDQKQFEQLERTVMQLYGFVERFERII
jgi:hypothetical protein